MCAPVPQSCITSRRLVRLKFKNEAIVKKLWLGWAKEDTLKITEANKTDLSHFRNYRSDINLMIFDSLSNIFWKLTKCDFDSLGFPKTF